MSKEDDYRRNAADAVELANRAASSSDKSRLLALAEGWLDLADRAHRRLRGRLLGEAGEGRNPRLDAE
jgi:hypothetical protein